MANLFGVVLILITSFVSISAAVPVGFTINPNHPEFPPHKDLLFLLHRHQISAVNLIDPTSNSVGLFRRTNISVQISLSNRYISRFSGNRSETSNWVKEHVLTYRRGVLFTLILVGDPLADPIFHPQLAGRLITAMTNLQRSLNELGMKRVKVSTALSFPHIVTSGIPPSATTFVPELIKPVLQFLELSHSMLFVKVYPNIFDSLGEATTGFCLFQSDRFNVRRDFASSLKYWNMFDFMVDMLVVALAEADKESIPIVVETGWPGDDVGGNGESLAEIYLHNLLLHLNSGVGTPLRRKGVAGAFIYKMFEYNSELSAGEDDKHWGFMYPNGTTKFKLDFSVAPTSSHPILPETSPDVFDFVPEYLSGYFFKHVAPVMLVGYGKKGVTLVWSGLVFLMKGLMKYRAAIVDFVWVWFESACLTYFSFFQDIMGDLAQLMRH